MPAEIEIQNDDLEVIDEAFWPSAKHFEKHKKRVNENASTNSNSKL